MVVVVWWSQIKQKTMKKIMTPISKALLEEMLSYSSPSLSVLYSIECIKIKSTIKRTCFIIVNHPTQRARRKKIIKTTVYNQHYLSWSWLVVYKTTLDTRTQSHLYLSLYKSRWFTFCVHINKFFSDLLGLGKNLNQKMS